MKIRKILSLLVILTLVCSLSAEVKIVPYYSLQFTEGAFVPNIGEWNFSLNLLNDIGFIVKPAEKHSVVTFYELKYTGPGMRRTEGEKFTDRAMDHMIIMRHTYNIDEHYFLKSQIDYMKEYKRTGSNEIWGTGLYDFNRLGGMFSFGRKFSDKLMASISGQYHSMTFPNYTDLLAEFQAGANAESSEGKQDHALIQAGFMVDYDVNHLGFDMILQNFKKQKVIVNTVQANGTYNSSDLQKDSIVSISAGRRQRLWEILDIDPTLGYKIKGSNQNYLYYDAIGSTVPPTYFDDYYSYGQINISVPFTLKLGEKWEVLANPEYEIKTYIKRQPRDDDGNFLSGKQKNNLFVFSYGFTFKPNVVTRTTLFHTLQSQSSNMEYEKYLPYNYTANFFGIKFDYTY